MPRALISSDTMIRSIKPGDPRKRLSDGVVLYLLLFEKSGAHGWRFDYVIHGRRKTPSLGTYPNTGLKLARIKANQAHEMVAAGTDPSDQRKATKFEHVQQREIDQRAAAFPAITDPKRLGELLRACDNYQGTHVVRAALRLAPMLLLRPGELRHAASRPLARWRRREVGSSLPLGPGDSGWAAAEASESACDAGAAGGGAAGLGQAAGDV